MNKPFEQQHLDLRERIIGLGECSQRKSYYPELRARIHELEQHKSELEQRSADLQRTLESLERARREQIHSEESFRALFEHISDGIAVIEATTGHCVALNTAMRALLKCDTEPRSKEELALVCETLVTAETRAHIQRAVMRGYEGVIEMPLQRLDGSSVFVEVHSTTLRFSGTRCWLGVFRDITRRQQIEAELKESERKYRLLAETMSDVIWHYDVTQQEFLYVSPSVNKLRGQSAELTMRQNIEDMLSPESNTFVMQTLQQRVPDFIASGVDMSEAYCDRLDQIHADGRLVPTEVVTRFIRNRDNGNVEIIGVSRDIGERQRLEAQLLQAQKMEAVGRLASGVAHDFNNIVTAIKALAGFMLATMEETNPLREDASDIDKAADRAASLTRQLLAFSRKSEVNASVININSLIDNLDKMLKPLIGEDIVLNVNFGEGLWSVYADKGQLEQVFTNLAVNARDAMPKGGSLHLCTRNAVVGDAGVPGALDAAAGQYVCISMQDNGIGIAPELMRHLFEPFFTTKAEGKGTGLGLATAYGIVRQAEGFIAITSEVGKGTEVSVYLPRSDRSANSGAFAKIEIPSGPFGAQRTVLLVEDEAQVRRVAKRLLEGLGFVVVDTGNGMDAIELARQHKDVIALLLTDVIMPLMSGPELAQKLSQILPQVPVVFMSGYTDDAISRHGLVEDECILLQKPFSLRDLRAILAPLFIS